MDMPGSIRHGFPTFLKIPYATISGRSLLRAKKADHIRLDRFTWQVGDIEFLVEAQPK